MRALRQMPLLTLIGERTRNPFTSIEDLRRRLSRSGEDASEDARRVKDSLADARRQLGLK